MKHTIQITALLFSFLIILSCSNESSSSSSSSTDRYKLVKVDSLIIDSLEELEIMDYSPSKDRFLAYGTNTKNCMEIDRKGNILKRVDLSGEGPGRFGPGMTELGYFEDGFVIKAPGVYNVFDKDWNYLYKIPYQNAGYSIPSKYIYGRPEVAKMNGSNVILEPNDESFDGYLEIKDDYYQNTNLLKAYQEGEEEKGLLNYPESSIYQNTNTFYSNHAAKLAYNELNDRLYVALPFEKVIYEYELSPDINLIQSDTLELTSFKEPQGIPFEDQHKNPLEGFGASNKLNYVYAMTNSSIQKIQSEDETLLVTYKTGTEGEANFADHGEALPVVRRQSKTYTAFFRDGKKVFETDDDLSRNVLVNGSQLVVPYVDEEVEMDYNLYYIYELKKVN